MALGDVAGHGVGPALLAASCRAYARVLAGVLAPASALTRLNARMSADAREGRFVTFALACVDPATFEVEAASAGHGPLLVVRAGGEVEELEVRSPPLGVLAEVDEPEACGTALGPVDAHAGAEGTPRDDVTVVALARG